ncbi:Stromal membrane-associated protein 2 [Armadillidium nasatum]|uniref:Stromal membrane-associated protein 2 n=1 Tax=Armadillidium nasatum TaxID=96803 RepID=A0A5N5SJL9_9CRUS|nr:Stromal membrane-associated protein 2 [Armadillidium nasatum]
MSLEKEKNKLVLEKCQNILKDLLKDEDNKYCVDCDAKGPRWASWNIGIFLCIRCAGIHRNLGVHISKVKSVNLDTWTPQQVACIQQMGNSRARAVYEANLQDNFRRPQTDSSLEQFIRAKYEAKKYIAREWVPPSMPNPAWDVEIENQLKKKREKRSSGGSVEFPASVKSSVSGLSPKPLPKAPGRKSSSPNQSKRSSATGSALITNNSQKDSDTGKTKNTSGTVDLLRLDAEATTNGTVDKEADIFGDFLAAPISASSALTSEQPSGTKIEESDFFNQKLPETTTSEKMSKDSILALYSQTPTHHVPPQQPLFGTTGGEGTMFLGGPVMQGAIPQPGVIGNPQHQNIMLYQQQQKGFNSVPTQGSYFPQAMPAMGGQMYPGMMSGIPQTFPTNSVGVQLSSANPFAQMQSQMGNLSLGVMMPQTAQTQSTNPSLMGKLMLPNSGMTSNPTQQPNSLSANHWQ